jgi:hypothetical protein
MSASDWALRRKVWYLVTIAAFLSYSFWIYVIVLVAITRWAAKKDSNPVALFVLLHFVVPPYRMEIPVAFIENLFEVDNSRIINLTLLMPLAWHSFKARGKAAKDGFSLPDTFVLLYLLLQLVLLVPYESVTNTLRRGSLLVIDNLFIYYAVSRACKDRTRLKDVMASFVWACSILAPMAAFETASTWLLYVSLAPEWGIFNRGAYLFRDGVLRAQVSTGHSLELGCVMAMAFGFWLYLGKSESAKSKKPLLLGTVWIWMGLAAAYARAAWVFGVSVYFILAALGKNGIRAIAKAVALVGVAVLLIIVSPVGDRFLASLPFFGTVDADNVVYRQRVAEVSWNIMWDNPLLGDPFFVRKMESLRQGENIIDLVNAYSVVALNSGLIGLTLFLFPMLYAIYRSLKLSRQASKTDPDLALLGNALVASILGYMFYIATAGMNPTFYLYLAMLLGYCNIEYKNGKKPA